MYNQAIQRCEEAVRLDPKLPDPYVLLGAAHQALSKQGATTTPDDVAREHRRKATENYKKFLALNPDDTEWRRRATHAALGALLGNHIMEDEVDEAALEYANRLAAEPSLDRPELVVLAGVYSRHARPELSERFLKRQLEADPSDAEVCQYLAAFYNEPVWNGGSRFDDSMGTLERCAVQSPDDPADYLRLATFLWDKAYLAGAQNVLMSLWSVPDRETQELMGLFYEKWLSGQTKHDALRAAQLEMRQRVRTRYGEDLPYYWAAFILVGR